MLGEYTPDLLKKTQWFSFGYLGCCELEAYRFLICFIPQHSWVLYFDGLTDVKRSYCTFSIHSIQLGIKHPATILVETTISWPRSSSRFVDQNTALYHFPVTLNVYKQSFIYFFPVSCIFFNVFIFLKG